MSWRDRNPLRGRPKADPDAPLPAAVERACDRLIAAVDDPDPEAACARAWADLVDARADAGPRAPEPPWDAAYAMLESRLGEGAADRVKAAAWQILGERAKTPLGQIRAVARRLLLPLR